MHCKATDSSMWLGMKHGSKGEQVFAPTVFLRTRARGCATTQHCCKDTQCHLPKLRLATSPHTTLKSLPCHEFLQGEMSGSFLEPRETPCDTCLCLCQGWKAFSNILLRDLWIHGNQLTSPEQVRQHLLAPQFGGW